MKNCYAYLRKRDRNINRVSFAIYPVYRPPQGFFHNLIDLDRMPEHNMDAVSKEWLQSELRSPTKKLIVLDCRSSNEFQEGHIRSAVNFSIPSLILKRLATGKIDLTSTIKCRDLKQRIQSAYTDSLFVLYNDVRMNLI